MRGIFSSGPSRTEAVSGNTSVGKLAVRAMTWPICSWFKQWYCPIAVVDYSLPESDVSRCLVACLKVAQDEMKIHKDAPGRRHEEVKQPSGPNVACSR